MRFLSGLVLGTILIIAAFSMNSLDAGGTSDPGIIINEIMYDPYSPEVEKEWVELWNSGAQAINIKNWTLSDQDPLTSVDYTFPDIDFPADAYALVHTGDGQNSTGFVDGKADFYMWQNSARWSSTVDEVLLSNETGSTIDYVSYGQWSTGLDPPPPDFNYTHSNTSAEEGLSLALIDGQLRQSIPTPLEHNREDVHHPLLITEVYYCPYPGQGEYIKIHNPLESAIDISYWYLTDLGGIIYFPAGTALAPGQSYCIAQNSTSYYLETLKVSDFEYDSDNVTISDMTLLGTTPKFANHGGEVFLMNNYGTIIDAFVYGDSTYTDMGWDSAPAPELKQGKVAKRNVDASYADTNNSADWQNLRQYRIAQSDFQAETFTVNGGITLFTSPDSSFGVIADALDSAQTSILLNVYEFTNTALLNKLLAAIGRGVDVKVFLEGAPVGGANRTELYIARQLVEAGGQVRLITNDADNDIHQRYAYDHAKYLVLDSKTLMIMSENWGRTGIPESGKWGNRGWGARIDDAVLASYFKDVFYTDWEPRMKDSVAFDASHPKWDDGMDCTGTYYNCTQLFVSSTVGTQALVTPVIAPDTALSQATVLGMLANARDRVCVEQFYIYKHWGDRATGSVTETPNIYLEAVIDAARRGCEVRVLLDASYYNVEAADPIDNDDTVDYVNDIAQAEDLNMTAKLVNMSEHDFAKIHNKGLIADDAVLISSINWNLNSVTENREAGLIIDNQEVAGFFMDVFEHDWTDDLTPPIANFDLQDTYLVNEFVEFNASASSDNVGIVNYTWQLDDVETSYNMKWMQVFESPANHTIELRVTDAWDNTANLTMTFSVVPVETAPIVNNTENGTETNDTGNPGTDDSTLKIVGILLLVPIAIFIALLWVVKVRER